MGFFSSNKAPASTDSFNEQEAFLAVALASSAADGEIVEDEVRSIFAYLLQMKVFRQVKEKQLSEMFKKLIKVLEKEGVSGLIAIAKSSLPSQLRESAFACAVDITLADGVLADKEKILLEELQKVLEVPDELGGMILKVMMVKNRG